MDEEKRIGVIYVYQDSESNTPYIKGKDDDEISYVTELSGKYEYLNKYIENFSFYIPVQRPVSYSIFNENKTFASRCAAFVLASLMACICMILFYFLMDVGLVWRASLEERQIGAMLGYSMCFSLILFGILIAGVLLLAFLNYSFNRKNKM